MRTTILLALLFLVIACSSNSKPSTSHVQSANVGGQGDGVKWFCYAYTYKGKALFERDGRKYDFSPTECNINVEQVDNSNDTLIYKINLYKDGFNYIRIYDGLMVYGFKYFKGAFMPLTGMVRLDHFDNLKFVREDNKKTDAAFAAFIKKADTSKLSQWLLAEARRRNVL